MGSLLALNRQLVRRYALQWQALRAWAAPLQVAVEVHGPRATYSGRCWCDRRLIKLYIRDGAPLSNLLATVLHELAHAAAPNAEHHGARWRSLVAGACTEITGVQVDDGATQAVLDAQVEAALSEWLRR